MKTLVNLYVIESKAFNTTGEYTKGIEKFVLVSANGLDNISSILLENQLLKQLK
jgi:hypothetical protein